MPDPARPESGPDRPDFDQLRALLASARWKEADALTRQLVCDLTGISEQRFVDPEACMRLSCADLRAIEALWVQASDGRYGFKSQCTRWTRAGGQAAYLRFEDLDMTAKEALGAVERRAGLEEGFPYQTLMCSYNLGLVGLDAAALAARLAECGLA